MEKDGFDLLLLLVRIVSRVSLGYDNGYRNGVCLVDGAACAKAWMMINEVPDVRLA